MIFHSAPPSFPTVRCAGTGGSMQAALHKDLRSALLCSPATSVVRLSRGAARPPRLEAGRTASSAAWPGVPGSGTARLSLALAFCSGGTVVGRSRRWKQRQRSDVRQHPACWAAVEAREPGSGLLAQSTETADSVDGAEEVHAALAKGWQDVGGCAVRVPDGRPAAVVHFLGGAFVGASPRLFYRTFLERLAEEAGAIVIATPYQLSFDYDAMAGRAAADFDAANTELARRGHGQVAALPVLAVGHSCGALLHALLAAERPYMGCVLMSFNNRPVSEAIPTTLPPPPEDPRVRQFLRAGVEAVLADARVEDSLRVGEAAAEFAANAVRGTGPWAELLAAAEETRGTATEAAPIFSQLGPLLGSVIDGTRDFSIAQEAVSERIRGGYAAPRTLLVQFANDLTDETRRLAGLLEASRCAGACGATELLRLPGGHTAPLDSPGLGPAGAKRLARLAVAAGRFARGEAAAEEAAATLPELKAQLLRLTAGLNRGLTPAPPGRRAAILACVEELEALAPEGEMSEVGVPESGQEMANVPAALFGNWRLVWATSPDVLLLAALPLLDCGEIRQDIPPQEVPRGGQLRLSNSVELSPRGLGLLGAVPQLTGLVTLRAAVRASAAPQEDGSLALRFEGGSLEPALPGLPALPLPTLPSSRLTSSAPGAGVRLLTTFVDSDFRFARSPLGDVFVLAPVD